MLHAGLTEDLVKISLFGQNEMDAFVEDAALYRLVRQAWDTPEQITEEPDGSYLFHFNAKRKANYFSILVRSRETGKVVRQIEPILMALIEAQKQDPTFKFLESYRHPSQMRLV